ncbi:MAG TPA: Gfo/Idh/MocA family oxidoreductase, partial [Burkholderiales bacterium]|nr:Gfo/Idh/MocA family oxidoreductase [Burkholderiales bacterium]
MADKIRVGVVGAGGNTRLHHIPKLKKIDGVEIASVSNRTRASSERVAQEFGIPRVHERWQELVNDPGIDAVVIGTWPYMHCPVTLAALEAGKHVLTEARIAMNAREARQMLAASRAHPNLVTQVVPGPATFAADPMVMHLLNDGYIGELQSMDLKVPAGFLNRDAPMHWRMDREFSGMNIMSMGIWYECVSRWVGPATAVMARTRVAVPYRFDKDRGERRSISVPDHVEVLADLANGAIARLHWSSVAGFMPGPEIWLYGSEGTLRIVQRGRDDLVLTGGKRGDKEMAPIEIPADKTYRWRVEEEFVGAIRGQEPVRRTSFVDA